MQIKSLSFLGVIITLSLLNLLQLGCAEQKKEPLRIAINQWPGYEHVYYAKTMGFYAEEGLNVEMVEFASLSDVLRSFQMGKVDLMTSTQIELLLAAEHPNVDPVCVGLMDYSHGSDKIIALSDIKTVANLKGKRIGYEASSLSIYILTRALATAELTLKDIKLEPLNHAEMLSAIASDQVDAIITYPPESTKLLENPKYHIIFDTTAIPGEVLDVVVANRKLLNEAPETVSKLRNAWEKTRLYIEQNPEKAYEEMGKRLRISSKEFKESMQGVHIITAKEQQNYIANGKAAEVIYNTYDLLKEIDVVKFPSLDPKTLIHP